MKKHPRIVLKITGQALEEKTKGNRKGDAFNLCALNFITKEISEIPPFADLLIVIGGGNLVRGSALIKSCGTTPPIADSIGMAATVMNGLLLEDALRQRNVDVTLMSAVPFGSLVGTYGFREALDYLGRRVVVIVAGGTGNSGVTTDTAALVRAYEIGASLVIKGTKVDGVCDCDPVGNPRAKLLSELSYRDFFAGDFGPILDITAVAQAQVKKIPIRVINLFKAGNLRRAVMGEDIGTLIS